MKLILSFVFASIVFTSCTKKKNISEKSSIEGFLFGLTQVYTIRDFATDIAEKNLIPKYKDLRTSCENLVLTAQEFEISPNLINLNKFQTAWNNTFILFKELEWAYMGPAFIPTNAYIYFEGFTKASPISVSLIESRISLNQSPSGVKSSGLDALEYLLFKSNSSTVLNEMQSQTFRREYARKIAQDVLNSAVLLVNGWDEGDKNSFYYDFTLKKASSSYYSSNRDVLNEITNQHIFLLNTIVDIKVAEPAGLRAINFGNKDPNKVECPYANCSLESIQANLLGLENVNSIAFSKLLKSRLPGIELRYAQILNETQKEIENLKLTQQSLKQSISNNQISAIDKVLQKLKILRAFINTEIISALGGTVGISTNDGD
ncbi:MAG: imelysin family protein [Leptospiraceae bacterium]|nr:imelysin family protein [Leptospiraceae bacterium]